MQDFTGIMDVLFFVRTTENLAENNLSVKTHFHFFGYFLSIDINSFVIEDKMRIIRRLKAGV